ncbi:hypothetical protein GE09DRAFT_1164296 [Coniochaeta sp. 2T2.1]|nr:hypothetical protein GE09DRAFT_1164296 [Coniochaeta sp. 2T2.1]
MFYPVNTLRQSNITLRTRVSHEHHLYTVGYPCLAAICRSFRHSQSETGIVQKTCHTYSLSRPATDPFCARPWHLLLQFFILPQQLRPVVPDFGSLLLARLAISNPLDDKHRLFYLLLSFYLASFPVAALARRRVVPWLLILNGLNPLKYPPRHEQRRGVVETQRLGPAAEGVPVLEHGVLVLRPDVDLPVPVRLGPVRELEAEVDVGDAAGGVGLPFRYSGEGGRDGENGSEYRLTCCLAGGPDGTSRTRPVVACSARRGTGVSFTMDGAGEAVAATTAATTCTWLSGGASESCEEAAAGASPAPRRAEERVTLRLPVAVGVVLDTGVVGDSPVPASRKAERVTVRVADVGVKWERVQCAGVRRVRVNRRYGVLRGVTMVAVVSWRRSGE